MVRQMSARLLALLLTVCGSTHAELVVTGIDDELRENVLSFSTLANEPCDTDPGIVRRRFQDLDKNIRSALEPFGYYSPAIETSLSFDESCWTATADIRPGAPVLIRELDIGIDGSGSTDDALAGLIGRSALATNAPLRHADYERLKTALQIRAADRGYIDASFSDARIDVWPEEGFADIHLRMESGDRYRLGDISVEQNFLRPGIVDGYLALEPGEYFDSADLTSAYRSLSDSGYFSRIDIRPDTERAAAGVVPVRVSLEAGTRIEYTIGAGASTDTGARLRGGFRNNRINNRGHRLIADVGVSQVVQGLTVEYRIPLSDPRREWFSFTGALSNEETDTFDNEAQSVGLRWSKAMTDSLLRTFALDVSNESFNVGEDIDTSLTVVPSITFDAKRADRDVFPTQGRRMGIELRGTDQSIGSDTSYLQATAWLRWIQSFGRETRLLARMNAGAIASGDFSGLPPTVRFFAGGDESIRGFDYESIGPVDADGNVIGGNNLLTASLEIERRLAGNFYGAAFVDAGSAFDDEFDAAIGAGLGLKWRSPLGPIRLYVGFPVSEDDKDPRLHLRLGADL